MNKKVKKESTKNNNTKTSKKTVTKNVKKTNTSRRSTKKKKKGFTLIELLAVIIILGILMIVAIPAVTSYISDSRKSAYVNAAKNIVSGARTKVNEGALGLYDTNATYYLPYDMIKTEGAAKSPYGEFTDAYVVVTYDGNGYDYYWTSVDDANIGMCLTSIDSLDSDNIATDIKNMPTEVTVGNRSRIVVFNKDGSIKSDHIASSSAYYIQDKGHLICPESDNSVRETDPGFFGFDESTGSIISFHEKLSNLNVNVDACISYLTNEYPDYPAEDAANECNSLEKEVSTYGYDPFLEEFVENGIMSFDLVSPPNEVVIPEEINGVKVIDIKEHAFRGRNLTKIVIPRTVQTIGYEAFDGDFLYSIVNKTGRSFDWDYVLGFSSDINESKKFETGSFVFDLHNYYSSIQKKNLYSNPYYISINISSSDDLSIDIDSMFESNNKSLTLKNKNGYNIYVLNTDTFEYEEVDTGPLTILNSGCGSYTLNYLVKENNSIVFAGRYYYFEMSEMCVY